MSAPEPAGGPVSLERLLATYSAWNASNVLDQAARRATDAGDHDRAATLADLAAGQDGAPPAIEALRAQHELVDLLSGWRWQTIAAARDAGATWDDIATATRATADQARADYLHHVEKQASYGAASADALDRYRAVTEPDDRADGRTDTEPHAMTDHPTPDRTTHSTATDLADLADAAARDAAERAWAAGVGPDEVDLAAEAARLDTHDTYLAASPAPGATPRAATEVEDALDIAAQDAALADAAHDPDPELWARYQALAALYDLRAAPAPGETQRAAPAAEQGPRAEEQETRDELIERSGPWTDNHGGRWDSLEQWARETCDPARATGPVEHPDDPTRIRERIEALRAHHHIHTHAEAQAQADDEQRRSQLAQWHHDDHSTADDHGTGHSAGYRASQDDDSDHGDGVGEGRW